MARFQGKINTGKDKLVTRLGNATDGITISANGWETGIEVDAIVDSKNKDLFFVYMTYGSGQAGGRERIGTVRIQDGKPKFEPEYIDLTGSILKTEHENE